MIRILSSPPLMSTAATPPAPPDFADWLDPLLVKELRQGLRNRVFVSAFLLSHAAVAIVLGFETLAVGLTGRGSGHEIWMGLQWAAEVFLVCLLLPMRGLSAAPEEARASGLDLLRLANLDAVALTYGKWKTQLLLAALLLVSLAPYHFLRYYVGGADIVGQALALLWCWSESAMLSAVCLWLSTLKLWARCLWGAALFLPLWFTLIPAGFLLFERVRGQGIVVTLLVWSVIWFGSTMFFLTLAISGFDSRMRRAHSAAPPSAA